MNVYRVHVYRVGVESNRNLRARVCAGKRG
jgi:hypothetical protein